MLNAHLDPPDDATGPSCNWCSDDPRPTAFCSARCEAESRSANACYCPRCDREVDPEVGCLNGVCISDDQAARDLDRELAYLTARGF